MTGGLLPIVDDPSLDGWATFLVYLATGWLCLRNARGSLDPLDRGRRRVALVQSRRRFWIVLATLLLLLGLTRQLNLQSLMSDVARRLVSAEGQYDAREGFQVALVIAVGVFGMIGLGIALFTFRRAEGSILAATAGVASLLVFTLIRLISLHDIDHFLGQGIAHARINNVIELGALAVIAGACFLFSRRLREEGESARLRTLSFQERRRRLGQKRRAGRS